LKATLTLILLLSYSLTFAAQTVTVMALASEPHHRLSLHNEYVNVYQVQVAPHDSVLLHRHDFDAISVMLSDAQVTVNTPGRPGVHRKLTAGQIRLQCRGYVHATNVDGDTTYRNVTVELLLPQQREHNLCSEVIPDRPLNCPAAEATAPRTSNDQLQFESDQTSVNLIHVLPHRTIAIGHPTYPELVIALDPDLATGTDKENLRESFDSGEFLWIEGDKTPVSVNNNGNKQSQIVVFTFRSH
jgi:hypothetical protein